MTPRDGLLGSVFDGITDFAVILVRVFPKLQALQVFIWYFAELNPVCLFVVPSPSPCTLRPDLGRFHLQWFQLRFQHTFSIPTPTPVILVTIPTPIPTPTLFLWTIPTSIPIPTPALLIIILIVTPELYKFWFKYQPRCIYIYIGSMYIKNNSAQKIKHGFLSVSYWQFFLKPSWWFCLMYVFH